MKTILVLLLLCRVCLAQNLMVLTYGNAVSNSLVFGLNPPSGLPISVSSTAATSAPAPYYLFSQSQFTNYLFTNATTFNTWQTGTFLPWQALQVSNQNYQVQQTASSNYTAWLSIYQQIPLGLTNVIATTNTLWGIFQSLSSGTNNLAQLQAQCKSLAQYEYVSFQYHLGILTYLNALGPGLQPVQNPSGP